MLVSIRYSIYHLGPDVVEAINEGATLESSTLHFSVEAELKERFPSIERIDWDCTYDASDFRVECSNGDEYYAELIKNYTFGTVFVDHATRNLDKTGLFKEKRTLNEENY